MSLNLEQIRQSQDGKLVDVEVPCWGGSVKVRTFSMGTALAIRVAEAEGDEQKLLIAAAKLIVEPDLDNEAGLEVLGNMTPSEFNDMWQRISEASGIDVEAEKKS